MASAGLHMLGIILSVLGWISGLVSCAMSMWKITAFIGNNIEVAQVVWEGLWMACVVQSTGQMQCKVYDSMVALPHDVQAARALMVIALLLALVGLLIYLAGAKCTTCIEDEEPKAQLVLISGVIFLISAVLVLIPVCWTAHKIIRNFYNPLVPDAQKRELEHSLYMGYASASLFILGGSLLCCTYPSVSSRGTSHYVAQYSASPLPPGGSRVLSE